MKSRTATQLGTTSTIRLALLCLPAVMVLLSGGGALKAADRWWDHDTDGIWGTRQNWATSVGGGGPNPLLAPGAGDNAFFNITGLNSNETATLAGPTAIDTMTFSSTGTVGIIGSGNQTLTLGSGGIIVNSGAGAVTIGSATAGQNVLLSYATGVTSQTWTNNSSNLLTVQNGVTSSVASSTLNINGTGNTTVAGPITGTSLSLVKGGGGTLVVSAASAYASTTTISANGGTLEISGATGSIASSSSITVNQGGTLFLNGSGGQNQLRDDAPIFLTNATVKLGSTGAINEFVGALTLSGTLVIDFGSYGSGQTLHFADIASWASGASITVLNYTGGDALFFGSAILDQTQLDSISFYDASSTLLGTGKTGPGVGQVSPVPEPSTVLAGLALVGLVAYRERRWFLRCRGARADFQPLAA